MANKTPKHQYLYLKAEAGNDRQIKGEGVIHLALGTKRGQSCQGLTRQEMHGGATNRHRRIIRKMTTTGNRFPEQTRGPEYAVSGSYLAVGAQGAYGG